ncbi:D-tyrosyl-tRNA(Tyr) deacylase [Acidihalobacter yilgarnensis]|uniref:D-aminoacyl-tRNA deacylase n=1 Tax=Acidihalobacter yilgarnensis TaxID=2819280 RepID=A0A1D8IJY5_9GAMM|nr:D-aminoacyl-tRNA deacylase [Acidihalobacter yilgarnensis]AOU96734.1 D-tyrosyl-tRNA(Tyr) deacylase [Acidihalobacter yilgarnensis]
MIGLLQRVSQASVRVDGAVIGEIGWGLLVLVGVERGDGLPQADRLLERLLGYRVFPDASGRMNLGLGAVGGGLLLVPQFTLVADTDKGLRPSFAPAAEPVLARTCFDYLLACAQDSHAVVASGRFGAEMSVALVNEGPVTFRVRVAPGG